MYTQELRDFFSEDPFGVLEEEDGNRGAEFAEILTIEEFSKVQSLDGTTRIRSRVRVGKEGDDFFFLHFEYDRRPKGGDVVVVEEEEDDEKHQLEDKDNEEKSNVVRPLSYGKGTSVTYVVTISPGFTVEPPIPLLVIEIDAKRDRPNKSLLPRDFGQEEEGEEVEGEGSGKGKGGADENDEADRYVVFVDPTECGALEIFGELLEKRGFGFDNDAPLVYLLICFQYYDLEWDIQKVILEGLLGIGEGCSQSSGDDMGSEDGEGGDDASLEIAESPAGGFEQVD